MLLVYQECVLVYQYKCVLALELEDVFRVKAKENLSKTGGDKKSGLQKSAKPIINAVDTRKELSKVASVSGQKEC